MNEQITILTVNYNSAEFVDNSMYALSKLTKNSYKFFITDNNSKLSDYKKLKKYVEKYDNVFLERSETDLTGSMAHGTALNELVKKVDTPYFSILDADATWLKKDWDEILINMFDDKIKLIGTQAPEGKPQDFPLMFTILFETEAFRKMNIDFRPKDIQARQDTGFEMRAKYLGAGLVGKNIEFKNTRHYKEGRFNSLVGVGEFYLDGDYDNIFASHFGRGSTLGASKYQKGFKKYFYMIPMLGNYVLKMKGKQEKKEWLNICKKIVADQVN